jgi:hypothetical protein
MRTTFFLLCSFWLWSTTTVRADLYQWTDAHGVIHVVDDASTVPEAYREAMKVYRAAKPAGEGLQIVPLSPSRTYAVNSQGAFAQKLALDFGLIKHSGEDGLSPLGGTGIQPAGGWQVSDAVTPEVLYEVVAATRRAADTRRLTLSADGAEAVVRQAAASFLPPPQTAQTPAPPPEEYYEESGEPEIVVVEQPPQIIEVIREPYYDPAPYVYGVPFIPRHHHHDHHGKPGRHPRPPAPPTGPHTTNPGPITHRPFGASHRPFGSSHLVNPAPQR